VIPHKFLEIVQDMLGTHWFWGALTLAVLGWYSTVTVYVAIRGAVDIKHMLRTLAAQHREPER